MSEKTTITVSEDTHEKLYHLKGPGTSFDDGLERILEEYEELQRE